MVEGKIVKSCLSECLRAQRIVERAAAEPKAIYAGNMQEANRGQPILHTAKWTNYTDVGSELQAIFSCDFSNDDRCSVFGCSPPVRSTNPLSRDCQFRSCILVNPGLGGRHSLQETYAAVMPNL